MHEPDDRPGSVVLSIDAELGWGFCDLPDPPSARVEAGRSGWTALADLLEEYEIPATWAVVGHLLLADCDGHHRDHPIGEYWFRRERDDWADREDLRFAHGLVERVADGPVDHEIACHTFSHVEFGDDATSRRVARAELARCREVFEQAGYAPTSIVFPRNSVGYLELLDEYGFDAYRGTSPGSPSAVGKVAATVGAGDPTVVEPAVDEHGLVDVPASLYLHDFEGAAGWLAESTVGDPVLARARRGIDAVASDGGVFHMWLHPNNLRGPREVRRCRRVLSYLDERRDDVAVRTMREVAASVDASGDGTADAASRSEVPS